MDQDENDITTWILDSGASRHLVGNLEMLENVVEYSSDCILDDNEPLQETHKENVKLKTKVQITLTNVHYCSQAGKEPDVLW